MKVYALAVLLVCCIAQNASADWRNDVKINHWQHINSIVNDNLARIRKDVNAKGNTAAAQQCYENARQELSTATSTGYSNVSACVRQANTVGEANVCSQKVDSWVFNVSLDVSSTARTCLANI
ncbi:uncharacterized protein LOC100680008 [Nasonia vitripennis]|uniref:Uncharacterized protein n=1 Tax=Nasonia vitripennis TaxID=7425 RepID=A0A7M7QX83_NASVI|nr:uncharacterized protein LOC100680008 [Nasonia vitripennis]XP_008217203.1 uncharacterized protein LOC100680008 [Nasonia vitripennis]XP_016844736.1 uncharacterized protein LOC100680008 [Nasonia vitripennis]XP_032456169.1 uncharacterized protein LOC100680008 [Nasonia vitripennis]XP_032456170.1 uncharacterized protein LOC100680008 [Nasonia vitripennis]